MAEQKWSKQFLIFILVRSLACGRIKNGIKDEKNAIFPWRAGQGLVIYFICLFFQFFCLAFLRSLANAYHLIDGIIKCNIGI